MLCKGKTSQQGSKATTQQRRKFNRLLQSCRHLRLVHPIRQGATASRQLHCSAGKDPVGGHFRSTHVAMFRGPITCSVPPSHLSSSVNNSKGCLSTGHSSNKPNAAVVAVHKTQLVTLEQRPQVFRRLHCDKQCYVVQCPGCHGSGPLFGNVKESSGSQVAAINNPTSFASTHKQELLLHATTTQPVPRHKYQQLSVCRQSQEHSPQSHD